MLVSAALEADLAGTKGVSCCFTQLKVLTMSMVYRCVRRQACCWLDTQRVKRASTSSAAWRRTSQQRSSLPHPGVNSSH